MNKYYDANALDILDVLTEYVQSQHFSILALFPDNLYEPGIKNQILGRAYGYYFF